LACICKKPGVKQGIFIFLFSMGPSSFERTVEAEKIATRLDPNSPEGKRIIAERAFDRTEMRILMVDMGMRAASREADDVNLD
jgi:hypothetical protein